MRKLAIVAALFGILFHTPLFSCSSFSFVRGEQCIVAKNYDWDIGTGLVIVNKRNVSKFSTLEFSGLEPGFRPVRWRSKYGSVTFNQYGREFPSGGMNETGLVIELLWLDEGVYPARDNRPAIAELEWIQYQLDRSKTINEVIANSKKVRIVSQINLHYLVCEQSGTCATVEFLNGKLVTHSRKALPLALLTNNTYENSFRHLEQYVGFGGNQPVPQGISSLDRFVRAASLIQALPPQGKNPVNDAFTVLNKIAQGAYTKWKIVYETKSRQIRFRSLASKSVKQIDMNHFDFSCSTPVKVINLNTSFSGDITKKLINYQTQINRVLVTESILNTPMFVDVPASVIEALALHPESTICME
jgi:choloylglycine hydrolase